MSLQNPSGVCWRLKKLPALVLVGVLAASGVGCRASSSASQAQGTGEAVEGKNKVVSPSQPTPAETAPGNATGDSGGTLETLLDPPRQAILKAQDETAVINLRSQPTTQSAIVGGALSGEGIQLYKFTEGEGGYTWYYIHQEAADQAGWVRGDFVSGVDSLSQNQVAIPQDASCGDLPQEAFFETPTFWVYICRTDSGLRYIGINRQTQAHMVTDNVTHSQETYIAIRGQYQHHVNAKTLAIYQVEKGAFKPLQGESVIRTQ